MYKDNKKTFHAHPITQNRFQRKLPEDTLENPEVATEWSMTMEETIGALKIVFVCLGITLVLYIISVLLYLVYNHKKHRLTDDDSNVSESDSIEAARFIAFGNDNKKTIVETVVAPGLRFTKPESKENLNGNFYGVIDDEEAMEKQEEADMLEVTGDAVNLGENILIFGP